MNKERINGTNNFYMSCIFYEVERFCEMLCAERNLSINTIKSYRSDIALFEKFFSQHYKISIIYSCPRIFCQAFFLYIRKTKKSHASAKRILVSLKSFSHYLITENVIKVDLCSHIHYKHSQIYFPCSVEKQYIQKVYNNIDKIPSLYTQKRNLCIIMMLYETGMRASELIVLKKDSIHKNEHGFYILVQGKGNKERYIPITIKLYNVIQDWISIRSMKCPYDRKKAFLFPSQSSRGHITRHYLYSIVRSLSLCDGNDVLTPHRLRHSFASHMLEDGLDVTSLQKILGHSSISSTQSYLKIANSYLKKEIYNHHPLIEKF